MNKILISVKARNGSCSLPIRRNQMQFGDSPLNGCCSGGRRGTKRTDQLFVQISLPGTQELMAHKYTAVILATGGSEMVRVAHSMGKPAYGVGPGNVRLTWIAVRTSSGPPNTSWPARLLITLLFAPQSRPWWLTPDRGPAGEADGRRGRLFRG